MKILKVIRNIIILVFVFGVTTAFIDYTRMMGGDGPIFNISTYNKVKKIQSYRGLFYQASRVTKVNDKEALEDSSDIKFYVLTIPIDVPSSFKESKFEFSIKTTQNSNCNGVSTLYYADEDIKVYTYCLDSISVLEVGKDKEESLLTYLNKDNKVVEDIMDNMAFTGLYGDNRTQRYKTVDNTLTDDGLVIIKCNYPNINDIYIGPLGMQLQSDFCTYKDDDFKFLAKIEEEKLDSDTDTPKEKEIFYEDDSYYYEFNEPKKDRIFVVAPAVRFSPERRLTLTEVLTNNYLTIDELEEKGLSFNKVAK